MRDVQLRRENVRYCKTLCVHARVAQNNVAVSVTRYAKNLILVNFFDFFEILNFSFFSFLTVFLVPELFRELRETRGINFHQVSSIYVSLVSSYDEKTEKGNEH